MKEYRAPECPTLREAVAGATAYLASGNVADAAVDAWYLMEHVTGINRAGYLAEPRRKMSAEQRDAYEELVNRRGRRIPLQHLTGQQEFMGLNFLVNEAVLIPRQDTETLVETALAQMPADTGGDPYRVLDLCTGSGCIAVSLAKLAGCPISVQAADISEAALAVAQQNAKRLDASVRFWHSDLFAQVEGVFDMIVSNPPYIQTAVIDALEEEVRQHEPHIALDGGDDGLYFYRRIARESHVCLAEGGRLLLEIGYDQGAAVTGLLRDEGFSEVRLLQDLAGNDRVVSGRLTGPGRSAG